MKPPSECHSHYAHKRLRSPSLTGYSHFAFPLRSLVLLQVIMSLREGEKSGNTGSGMFAKGSQPAHVSLYLPICKSFNSLFFFILIGGHITETLYGNSS